ncbi:hypothetical protein BC834DRAFT_193919 [Gloeopeniophorella convolvens]|nr:hypothetical protein BC834DRAFT_193919 [Gloeopeniophorella convolvens]
MTNAALDLNRAVWLHRLHRSRQAPSLSTTFCQQLRRYSVRMARSPQYRRRCTTGREGHLSPRSHNAGAAPMNASSSGGAALRGRCGDLVEPRASKLPPGSTRCGPLQESGAPVKTGYIRFGTMRGTRSRRLFAPRKCIGAL